MNIEKRYCVYADQRRDNGTYSYIGRGTQERIKIAFRNYPNEYLNTCVGLNRIIICDRLSYDESVSIERDLIADLVKNGDYGIDVPGYRKYPGKYLTNRTFGAIYLRDQYGNTYSNKIMHTIRKLYNNTGVERYPTIHNPTEKYDIKWCNTINKLSKETKTEILAHRLYDYITDQIIKNGLCKATNKEVSKTLCISVSRIRDAINLLEEYGILFKRFGMWLMPEDFMLFVKRCRDNKMLF